MCRFQIVLIVPVSGSANNTISSALVIFMKTLVL
jgi:hypothetical protein